MLSTTVLALLTLAPAVPVATPDDPDPIDLGQRYPSTLAATNPPTPLGWVGGSEHTYRLAGFRFAEGGRLSIETGPALLTLGVNPNGPVWAAVLPDQPATIEGTLPGAGERVRSLYLRFHPDELGDLFPAGAAPAGDEGWRFRSGVRIAMGKQANSWASRGLPVVPPRATVVLDCATVEGPRRFYMREGGGEVDHYADFVGLAVPPDPPLEEGAGARGFATWWEAFDRQYAMFGIRDLDWDAVRERFEPLAAACTDAGELACVVAAAAATLGDRHAWVRIGGVTLPHEFPPLAYNANFQAVMAELEPMTQPRRGINWSRTADDIGYVNVAALDGEDLVGHFDRALEDLADVRGLVLDLRFNSGGNEVFAQAMAGRFLVESTVYATQRYRSGPARTDLGPWTERRLEPRGERFGGPVVVLIGPAVMSSGEGFVLALAACPETTLLGAPTAGSSGNPMTLELVGGIEAAVPRWLAADPEHRHFEGRGIEPEVRVEPAADAFAAADPVFTAALERLREGAGR